MNGFKRYFRIALSLVVIAATLFLIRKCNRGRISEPQIIETIVRDTVLIEIQSEPQIEYVPQYVEILKMDTVLLTEIKYIDTTKVLLDYFSEFLFVDTIEFIAKVDSFDAGYLILSDLITNNTIKNRQVDWHIRFPVISEEKIIERKRKTEWFAGVDGGFNNEDWITALSGSIIVSTKSGKLYKVGVGLQNNSNTQKLIPFIETGIYWRIR